MSSNILRVYMFPVSNVMLIKDPCNRLCAIVPRLATNYNHLTNCISFVTEFLFIKRNNGFQSIAKCQKGKYISINECKVYSTIIKLVVDTWIFTALSIQFNIEIPEDKTSDFLQALKEMNGRVITGESQLYFLQSLSSFSPKQPVLPDSIFFSQVIREVMNQKVLDSLRSIQPARSAIGQ